MTKKHVLLTTLLILILGISLVLPASAFTYTSPATITPAASLNVGQLVTGSMKIVVTKDSMNAVDKLVFTTPLKDASWQTSIFKGDVEISNTTDSAISGFALDYSADLTLDITVSGKVASASRYQDISILTITASAKEPTGYLTYSSPLQHVYMHEDGPTPVPIPQPTTAKPTALPFTPTTTVFTYMSPATITPSTSLNVGQLVTGSMKIVVKKDSMSAADKLVFTTPLKDASWHTSIFKGDVEISKTSDSTISGFALDYRSDLTLDITLSGTVASASAGQDISIMTITATGWNGYGTCYSSPVQYVYNPESFAGDISARETRVTNLDTRITAYIDANYGIDMSAAIATLEQAKTKIAAAKTAGTSDLATAYANIEAADKLLTTAEQSFSLTALKAVKANTEAVDDVIAELYSKGWSTEAKLLDTKNAGLKNRFDRYAATYNAGGIPDAGELDRLVADAYALVKEAGNYLNGGTTPEHLTTLSLVPGWNFFSIPKTLNYSANTAGVLFNGIDTDDRAPLIYNAEAQEWVQITGTAVLSPLTGYWIYANEAADISLSYPDLPATPSTKTIYPGWNAVGLSAESATPATSALSGIEWRVAIPWNLAKGTWGTTIINGGSSLNSPEQRLGLGNGYWLYANTEGTLLGLTA